MLTTLMNIQQWFHYYTGFCRTINLSKMYIALTFHISLYMYLVQPSHPSQEACQMAYHYKSTEKRGLGATAYWLVFPDAGLPELGKVSHCLDGVPRKMSRNRCGKRRKSLCWA